MKSRQLSVAGLLGFVTVSAVLCALAPVIGTATSICALVVQTMLLAERCLRDDPSASGREPRQ